MAGLPWPIDDRVSAAFLKVNQEPELSASISAAACLGETSGWPLVTTSETTDYHQTYAAAVVRQEWS